jgi:hypothetical protein
MDLETDGRAALTEQRRLPRMKLRLSGRVMRDDRSEFLCETIDVSAGGISIATAAKATVGSQAIVYLEKLGRMAGTIIRNLENGFALAIAAGPRKHEKLAAQLEWLANRDAVGLAEGRHNERIELTKTNTTIMFADGRSIPAVVIDCSISGAALECKETIPVGSAIKVGRREGLVRRQHTGAVAVNFVEPIAAERFGLDFEL